MLSSTPTEQRLLDAAYLLQVETMTGPESLPSSEAWTYPAYTNGSAPRSDFDSDGVPVGWTPPSQAGDFFRLLE